MKTKILCVSAICVFFLSCGIGVYSQELGALIPSPKKIDYLDGAYSFSANSKLVLSNEDKVRLSSVAAVFIEDLNYLLSIQIEQENGGVPSAGDINIKIDPKASDSLESYLMKIDDKITITAKSDTGIYYGLQTLLQLLKQGKTIHKCLIKDWADYRERGLMVDNGFKFFSVDWFKKQIREMAYTKMNFIQFHVGENQGFRLYSDKFAKYVKAPYYTKKDVEEIVEFASKRFVEIVPEIDIPGHAYCFCSINKSLPLVNINGDEYTNYMDITKPEVREFVKSLYEEYIPWFKGKYWHLGCDEYDVGYEVIPHFEKFAKAKYGAKAVAKDAFNDYINWADSIARAHGKISRMWNDPISYYKGQKDVVKIDTSIIIDVWDAVEADTVDQVIAKGYKVMNSNKDYLYYDLGTGYKPVNWYMSKNWRPNLFNGEREIPALHPKNLGAKISIWSNKPETETEDQVAKSILPNLRLMSQFLWNSMDVDTSYKVFSPKIAIIGSAPGVFYKKNPLPGDIVFGKKVAVSSTEKTPGIDKDLMVDGDYETRWASGEADSAWILIDLEEEYTINTLKLSWEWAFARAYQVQISKDSKTWNTFIDKSGKEDSHFDLYQGLAAKGRYLKILCNRRVSDQWGGYSLYEIEAYDSSKIKNDTQVNIDINKSELFNKYITQNGTILNIEFTNVLTENTIVQLVSLSGELLSVVEVDSDKLKDVLSIPISMLSSGAYLIRVWSEDNEQTQKFIIRR
jgi:hexosaminidase